MRQDRIGTVHRGFKVPAQVSKDLDAEAERLGISKSYLASILIEEGLKQRWVIRQARGLVHVLQGTTMVGLCGLMASWFMVLV